MKYQFKLNEEESKVATLSGLPTDYLAFHREGTGRVEIWYKKESLDRFYSLSEKEVNDKFEKGIWIKS